MEGKETFDEWVEKHASDIVDEVLKSDTKNQDVEYHLYKGNVLVNTYSNKEIAIRVAKKKGYTIRHVKQSITQPAEEEKT